MNFLSAIVPRTVSSVGAVIQGLLSQTEDLQQWQRSTGVVVARVKANGSICTGAGGGQIIGTDSGVLFGTARLEIEPGSASLIGITVRGRASQAADLQKWEDDQGIPLSRIDRSGYFITRKVAAPADADIATNEAALFFDSTAGSPAVKARVKDSAGSLSTLTLSGGGGGGEGETFVSRSKWMTD